MARREAQGGEASEMDSSAIGLDKDFWILDIRSAKKPIISRQKAEERRAITRRVAP